MGTSMGTTPASGARVRSDYRCGSCGYGVVAADVPPACPMCGGTTWDHAEWRPFSGVAPEPLTEATPIDAEQAPTAA
jgi:rubredoxin